MTGNIDLAGQLVDRENGNPCFFLDLLQTERERTKIVRGAFEKNRSNFRWGLSIIQVHARRLFALI